MTSLARHVQYIVTHLLLPIPASLMGLDFVAEVSLDRLPIKENFYYDIVVVYKPFWVLLT